MKTGRLGWAAVAAACIAFAPGSRADEGMWTFNNFPSEKVEAKYHFKPDGKWLDHVRLSSVRLAQGCSGSFISASGLVMTNHHCAHSCIQQLSTPQKDFIKSGFTAKTEAEEVKCPEIEINNLVDISDVTARINKATAGLTDQKYNDAEKAEMSRIEKECATSDKVRCDVVRLYHGGVYDLYKYRRYQDVRLVFAPELAIAFFGGDPDNFNFPRYDLDISLLRVYEDGKPAKIDNYLAWSTQAAKAGDLTFVSGHPGGTSRAEAISQLAFERDVALPDTLFRISEMRGRLIEFGNRGAEQKRIAGSDLFGYENAYKALKGRFQALTDEKFFGEKVAEERAVRAKVDADPELKKKYGGAWDAIAKATAVFRQMRDQLNNTENLHRRTGDLFAFAWDLVRGAEERPKPLDKRYREFRDSNLPAITQSLFSTAPIYDDLEELKLGFALSKMRETLGADDAFVHKVLGKQSPEQLAHTLISTTKLKDLALRKQLWEGGKKAVDASSDPLIKFCRMIDPDARAARKKYEDEVEGVLKKNEELTAKARFAAQGTSTYPDATFTLRLSYGAVRGWMERGKMVDPITRIGGAYARATGQPPFDLPESWLKAKAKLNPQTPFNLCTDNDIIGGNSGSPMVNKAGQVVGLVFDGNIHSLAGDYGFNETDNRTVAVHSAGILEALSKVYAADRIVKEIRGGK